MTASEVRDRIAELGGTMAYVMNDPIATVHGDPQYSVSWRMGENGRAFGRGDSWQAALADAEANQTFTASKELVDRVAGEFV